MFQLLRILALFALVFGAIVLIGMTDAWWTFALGIAVLFVATVAVVLSTAAALTDHSPRHSR